MCERVARKKGGGGKKSTVYMLATHGPLSHTCSKNWLHTLPAKRKAKRPAEECSL
jgi:hypothetical protein